MSGHGGQTAAPPPVNAPPVKELEKLSLVTPAPPLMVPLVPSAAKKLRTPARSGFGSVGRKMVIKANHFLVGVGNKDPHQYDVTIAPEVTSKTKSRDIMKFLSDSYGASHLGNLLLAYDGKKSAFIAGPLPVDSKEFVVKIAEQNGREREFKVTIKFAARKELVHLRQFLAGRQHDNPQETIQALDVVLRESASKDREIVGRSLFHTDFGRGPLGDGIEYWKGFYQSLRPTQMGLSLNIDMSARAFYEPKLLSEFVGEFLGSRDMSRPLSDQERIKVKRALKGVRVEVRRQDYKRRYKVQGLTAQPISQLNFIDETGATKTVVQYFREKYNVQLRFPALPAVQAGTDTKPTYLPMEICWVTPGQRYALKLNERQVTQFLRATCQRPKDREDSIDNTMKKNKYNKDPLVSKDFEMNVTELLTSIEARVLPPPPLRYHESGRTSEVNPSVGQWNMIDLKVINGGTVNYWAIINFSRHNEQAVGRFVHGLVSMCQTKGIVFNPQPLIPMRSAMPHNIEKALVDLQSQASAQLARVAPGHPLQMLFVILPETKGTYPRIKRVCETELGIVSQCCKPQHVMKINVKVGGRNTVLAAALNVRLPYITDRPTIIFGADVTHPQPGEDSSPSIAAVFNLQSLIPMRSAMPLNIHKALVDIQSQASVHEMDTILFVGGGGGKRSHETENLRQQDGKRRRLWAVGGPVAQLLPRTVRGKLLERIHRQNLIHVVVEGDGNCQYRAVSRAIHGTEWQYEDVKAEVINEMRENPLLYMPYGRALGFRGMHNIQSFNNYVDGLAKEYAWGNYLTLYAVANKFHVRVNIVCSIANDKMAVLKEIVPVDWCGNEIYVSYIYYSRNNAHYDSLIQSDDVGSMGPPMQDRLEILVKNLPHFVTGPGLVHVFSEFGDVLKARVIDRKLGIGLVEMRDPHEMKAAIMGASNCQLWPQSRGRKVEVTAVKLNQFDIQAAQSFRSYF